MQKIWRQLLTGLLVLSLCLGMIGGTALASDETETTVKRGIDVSHHQGEINWAKVKAAGIDFAIIRCGYGKFDGKLHTDKYFYQNIKNAKAAGLKVGIYFFSYAYTKQMAVEEAKYVLNLLKGYKLNLPVYFDWEYDSMDKAKAKAFFEEKTGASMPQFKVNMEAFKLLRKFILEGSFDIDE